VPQDKLKGILISDSTLDSLAGYLQNDDEPPAMSCAVAPYDQVMSVLLDDKHDCWKENYDFAVVWTLPHLAAPGFGRLLDNSQAGIDEVLAEVDQFANALRGLADRVRFVFVPSWVLPQHQRGLGMLNLKPGGPTSALMQMNLRLSDGLADLSGFFVLDAGRWVASAGRSATNPKLWYMGKVAFANDVLMDAAGDIKAALNGLTGNSRKLVVVDLDDTLWGGIVGDDGWENLKLGGHDFTGEAYADFQRALKSLTNRGVLLGIVSKNEEDVAMEAIEKHPEMVLKQDDFAGWRINWNDKAQNLIELVEDLNLGLQSVVFVDDNPVERARVRDTLPEVLVVEMPSDKTQYARTLRELRCFDTPSVSREDVDRARMYVSERKRKDLKKSISSPDDWLRSLDITVRVEPLSPSNLERTAQLFNKTNQMNLSTRRMSENELKAFSERNNHRLWTLRVSDKFGDSGLTGIVSLEVKGETARIIDFILSCRVMGRRVEETMVHLVCEYARSAGLRDVVADFIPTKKNKPCFDFWTKSGFEYDEGTNRFTWSLDKVYPAPATLKIDTVN